MSLAPGRGVPGCLLPPDVEIALATHALGTFRISFWKFGPTELRILLAIGTLQLVRSPWSTVAGQRVLLFDVGATVGAVAVLFTFLVAAVTNTRALYRLEPLPQRNDAGPLRRISTAVVALSGSGSEA